MTFGRRRPRPTQPYQVYYGGRTVTSGITTSIRVTVDYLAAGRWRCQTSTPATPGWRSSLNLLDPMVRVYNSAGVLVASNDNGATDGRNAEIELQGPQGGRRRSTIIEVLPPRRRPSSTRGEYILSVKQDTACGRPSGSRRPRSTARLRRAEIDSVDFNDFVLLTTLEASDLTIDGVAAAANGGGRRHRTFFTPAGARRRAATLSGSRPVRSGTSRTRRFRPSRPPSP